MKKLKSLVEKLISGIRKIWETELGKTFLIEPDQKKLTESIRKTDRKDRNKKSEKRRFLSKEPPL